MTTKQVSSEVTAGTKERNPVPRAVQDRILDAIASISYGSVEVVIQDGTVVQIESREKQRIDRDSRGAN